MHSREHMEESQEGGSHEDINGRSREDISESHEGSREEGDTGFWRGCSERWWGDEEHEFAAKKFAFLAIILVVVIAVVTITIVVVCCKRKRAARAAAAARHNQIKQAVIAPVTVNEKQFHHPKAIEAFGPTGLPDPVVVCVPEAPMKDGEKDPRVMIGVWSPPPSYEVAQE